MAKKNSPNWGAVKATTNEMAKKDLQNSEKKESDRKKKATLKLDQIKDREADTRPINLAHVEALANSIAVLGLLEPLVVDLRNRLLAGGHRLTAIKVLKEQNLKIYEKHFSDDVVQVRIMSFDAEEEPDLALQVEVAENEHRRDYTPTEVKVLAERLQKQGYKRLKGRPKKNEKSLMQALAFVINKSKRTVERYLQEDNHDTEKSATAVALSQEQVALKKCYKNLQSWQKIMSRELETPKRQLLMKKLPRMMKTINAALAEINVIEYEE